MTTAEIIKGLKSVRTIHNGNYAPFIDGAIKELKVREWIPCSERLPKAEEYVGSVAKYYLVQNEYGDMLVARYTHSGYWEQIYHLKPYADEIVAWMPLPQKYKEEGWAKNENS